MGILITQKQDKWNISIREKWTIKEDKGIIMQFLYENKIIHTAEYLGDEIIITMNNSSKDFEDYLIFTIFRVIP